MKEIKFANTRGMTYVAREIDGYWHALGSNGGYTSAPSLQILETYLRRMGFKQVKVDFPKGDTTFKETLSLILKEGCLDEIPRPHYEDILASHDNWHLSDNDTVVNIRALDSNEVTQRVSLKNNQWVKTKNGKCVLCTPAHTLSVNHIMHTYDLSKGEFPITTLRPTATRSAIGEILWIYQDMSNDLNLLKEKYGITWWNEWDIGDHTIGACYGETVKRHNLMENLLNGLSNNPDGRRHIMSLWQEEDFSERHGLKPCAFQTIWNVRHGKDGVKYLDMMLVQRSSDFVTAGAINQVQYAVLLALVARHIGCEPGKFSWSVANVQIYDRHIPIAKQLLERRPVKCNPEIWINPDKKSFWDMTIDDIKIVGYPIEEIKKINPQVKLELGI